MKIHRILCLSVVIALPQLALAKLPPNSALGQVEGTLDFCAEVDPQSTAKYEGTQKALGPGRAREGSSGGSSDDRLQRGVMTRLAKHSLRSRKTRP